MLSLCLLLIIRCVGLNDNIKLYMLTNLQELSLGACSKIGDLYLCPPNAFNPVGNIIGPDTAYEALPADKENVS